MKTKKFQKKLNLKRSTISNLNSNNMKDLIAGIKKPAPVTNYTCLVETCNTCFTCGANSDCSGYCC
jgi:hypothetical protein